MNTVCVSYEYRMMPIFISHIDRVIPVQSVDSIGYLSGTHEYVVVVVDTTTHTLTRANPSTTTTPSSLAIVFVVWGPCHATRPRGPGREPLRTGHDTQRPRELHISRLPLDARCGRLLGEVDQAKLFLLIGVRLWPARGHLAGPRGLRRQNGG